MMNSSETKTKYASAKATNMRRRILAATCAFAIALLQCAVILTVETEDVSAASVEVKAKCVGGTAKKSVNTSELSNAATEPIPGVEGKKGLKLETLFSLIVDADGDYTIKDFSKTDLLEPTEMKVYKADGTSKDVSEILFNMESDYTPVQNITLNDSSISLEENHSKDITYTVSGDSFFAGENGNYSDYIEWSSDDPSIASVSNGRVTAKKAGTTTIKVQSKVGGITKSIGFTGTTKSTTTTTTTTKSTTAKKTSIGKAKVSISDVTYNGKSRKPSPTVKLGKKTLKEGRDYTVSYSNNKKVGTATVTITGKGKYKGSITTTFQIKKKSSTSTRATTRSGSSYRPITRVTGSASNNGTTTGTTVPNVTYAPDRTITVKEVFIGAKVDDTQQQDPYSTDPYNTVEVDPYDDWDDGSDDWSEEDPAADLDFGPMAGSAAVAAAACGAGAVGRIRRFKVDTAAAVTAAVTEKKVGKLFKKKG